MERLENVAEGGDIEALYSLIMENPYILEGIDEVPFINTPLHIAASKGHLPFAKEIMRLKPSYVRKLNKNGLSPIHVALEERETKLVLGLLEVERDIVRIRGKESRTPLHLAAEYGMVDVLAKFLVACPKSIQDLTIRKETALHIAVKFNNLEALKVLLGWLEHVGKDAVLDWGDDEGNTILHLAAYLYQDEMVSLFINRVNINATNSDNLTTLDVISQEPTQRETTNRKRKIKCILLRNSALKASSLASVSKLEESLQTKMSWHEKWMISDYRKRLYLSNGDRKIILLAAVLFATANYQAVLDSIDKPDANDDYYPVPMYRYGMYLYDYNPQSNSAYNPVSPYDYISNLIFTLINNIAFLASMVEIYLHLPSDCGVLRLVLPLVIFNYVAVKALDPISILVMAAFLFLFYYSKPLVILHKFVPISAYEKSMKIKLSIFQHCSSFHKDVTAEQVHPLS